jgi:hypothetical protein
MRKPDPVDIIAIYVPEFVKAVVVAFAVGVAMMWVTILAGRLPEIPV